MLRFLKKDKDGPGPPVKTPVTEAYNVGSLSYIIPNSDGRASITAFFAVSRISRASFNLAYKYTNKNNYQPTTRTS
jgi:hypothetical protein